MIKITEERKKEKVIFYILVNLALIIVPALPGLTQSRRQPTEVELQRLKIQFRNEIPKLEKTRAYGKDNRSSREIQQLEKQINSWSPFFPELSSFLGTWSGWEEFISIYPSMKRQQACAIISGSGSSDTPRGTYVRFALLEIKNDQLRANYSILLRENKFLVFAFVYDNQPSTSAYAYPRPLKYPTELPIWNTVSEKVQNQVLREFNAAGCTVEATKSF